MQAAQGVECGFSSIPAARHEHPPPVKDTTETLVISDSDSGDDTPLAPGSKQLVSELADLHQSTWPAGSSEGLSPSASPAPAEGVSASPAPFSEVTAADASFPATVSGAAGKKLPKKKHQYFSQTCEEKNRRLSKIRRHKAARRVARLVEPAAPSGGSARVLEESEAALPSEVAVTDLPSGATVVVPTVGQTALLSGMVETALPLGPIAGSPGSCKAALPSSPKNEADVPESSSQAATGLQSPTKYKYAGKVTHQHINCLLCS